MTDETGAVGFIFFSASRKCGTMLIDLEKLSKRPRVNGSSMAATGARDIGTAFQRIWMFVRCSCYGTVPGTW